MQQKFYPITLTPDDNGTILVTSPDFPELTTFGESVLKARINASDAFVEVVKARKARGEAIPEPTDMPEGGHMVAVWI